MSFAVNIGAEAFPETSAPTVTVFAPLVAKRPLAPLEGAVKVTGVPTTEVTGQPLLLASATWRGLSNAVSSCAVCGVPPPRISSFGGLDVGHELDWSGVSAAARGLASVPTLGMPTTTATTAAEQQLPSKSWVARAHLAVLPAGQDCAIDAHAGRGRAGRRAAV